MVNLVQGGDTLILSPDELTELGFSIAISPLALMASAMQAMKLALADLKNGVDPDPRMMPFDELRRVVGFDDYYEAEKHYTTSAR